MTSPEVTSDVERALQPLESDQQRVIDLVGDAYFGSGGWPVFQFIQASFDSERLDVKGALSALPNVGAYGIQYGPTNLQSWANVADSYNVQLTLLGLHHYQGAFKTKAAVMVQDLFRVMRVFGGRRRSFRPQPLAVTPCRLTSDELMSLAEFRRATPPDPEKLYEMMRVEPAFLHGNRGNDPQAGTWWWEIPRDALNYEDITAVEQYIARIAELYPRPAPAAPVAPYSPRSLPAALDYLDVVWRLSQSDRRHLVRLPSAEGIMLLGYSVAGREDFLERLGTLGDLLSNLVVPKGGDQGGGNHALVRLRAYLRSRLSESSHQQAVEAIVMLQQVTIIRNAGAHADAQTKAIAAYKAIGIPYPAANWTHAWEAVSNYTVRALDMLREEVARLSDLPEPDETL